MKKVFTDGQNSSACDVCASIYRNDISRTCERRAAKNLIQWPCKIDLVPSGAPYFDGAHLLIAADCTACAYNRFQDEFMRNRITLIGCSMHCGCNYTDKLTKIISDNDIKSVTIVRMEVDCCAGFESAAKEAIRASGKFIPWQVITVSTDGKTLD